METHLIKVEVEIQEESDNEDVDVEEEESESDEEGQPKTSVSAVQCTICKKTVSSRKNLLTHHKLKHPHSPYKIPCQICQQLFSRAHDYRTHVLKQHPDSDQLLKCSTSNCDYKSVSHIDLSIHKKKCVGFKRQERLKRARTKKIPCDKCGKPFGTAAGIVAHKIKLNQNCQAAVLHCKEKNCGMKFYCQAILAALVQNAHSRVKFSCSTCNGKYKSKLSLDQHIKLSHTKIWSCDRVGCTAEIFSSKTDLIRHKTKCSLPIPCVICEQIFKNEEEFSAHTHKFKCGKCDKNFEKKSLLDLHANFHDPAVVHKCDPCAFAYGSKGELTTHLKSSHRKDNKFLDNFTIRTGEDGIYYFTCKLCEMEVEFIDPSAHDLIEHRNSTHSDQIGAFVCPTCGKSLSSQICVFNHRNKVHGIVQTDFKCEICDKYFINQHGLNSHDRKIHYAIPLVESRQEQEQDDLDLDLDPDPDPNDLTARLPKCSCLICGKKCISLAELTRHMNYHDMDKEYKCELCTMSWSSPVGLNKHNRARHPDLKPVLQNYKCEHCGKSYKAVRNLKMHLKTHSEDKFTSKCKICDKVFMCQEYLDKHQSVHNAAERPKPCDFCGKSFSRRNKLSHHIRRHHRTDV